jgi:hypothetical protein
VEIIGTAYLPLPTTSDRERWGRTGGLPGVFLHVISGGGQRPQVPAGVVNCSGGYWFESSRRSFPRRSAPRRVASRTIDVPLTDRKPVPMSSRVASRCARSRASAASLVTARRPR